MKSLGRQIRLYLLDHPASGNVGRINIIGATAFQMEWKRDSFGVIWVSSTSQAQPFWEDTKKAAMIGLYYGGHVYIVAGAFLWSGGHLDRLP